MKIELEDFTLGKILNLGLQREIERLVARADEVAHAGANAGVDDINDIIVEAEGEPELGDISDTIEGLSNDAFLRYVEFAELGRDVVAKALRDREVSDEA